MKQLFILSVIISFVFIPVGVAAEKQETTVAAIPPSPATTVIDGPSIELLEKNIELGDIPREANEIVGKIVYFNKGTKTLNITNVDGPCICYLGHTGDEKADPNSGGEITVRFDKSKIAPGKGARIVNLTTNDLSHKLIEVKFHFNVRRDPLEEEVRALRQELKNMGMELSLLRNDLKGVSNQLLLASQTAQTAQVLAAQSAQAAQAAAAKASQAATGQAAKAPAPNKKQDTTVYAIAVGDSPVRGPKNAAVTITEFIDFQCPYCVKEYPTIEKIMQEFPEDIKLVFKHYPLKFHAKAKPVHALTELAKKEKGEAVFWQLYSKIMENPQKIGISDLKDYARDFGLDGAKFDAIIADASKTDDLFKADAGEAQKCNVTGTPSIYINGLRLYNRDISGYRQRVNEILNKPTAAASVTDTVN